MIFASIAIRALKDHPEFSTPSVVEGIRKLIAGFNNSHPGSGFYGKEKGRILGNKITLPEDDTFPPYQDMAGMATAVLDQLILLDPKIRRQGYGGLVHITNHAAAITDLVQYGYPELLPKALASHHRHMRLYRDLPNLIEQLGAITPSEHTPNTSDYWTSGKVPYNRGLLTHRVKTMFGFDELVEVIDDDAKVKKAYGMLRYMM